MISFSDLFMSSKITGDTKPFSISTAWQAFSGGYAFLISGGSGSSFASRVGHDGNTPLHNQLHAGV